MLGVEPLFQDLQKELLFLHVAQILVFGVLRNGLGFIFEVEFLQQLDYLVHHLQTHHRFHLHLRPRSHQLQQAVEEFDVYGTRLASGLHLFLELEVELLHVVPCFLREYWLLGVLDEYLESLVFLFVLQERVLFVYLEPTHPFLYISAEALRHVRIDLHLGHVLSHLSIVEEVLCDLPDYFVGVRLQLNGEVELLLEFLRKGLGFLLHPPLVTEFGGGNQGKLGR